MGKADSHCFSLLPDQHVVFVFSETMCLCLKIGDPYTAGIMHRIFKAVQLSIACSRLLLSNAKSNSFWNTSVKQTLTFFFPIIIMQRLSGQWPPPQKSTDGFLCHHTLIRSLVCPALTCSRTRLSHPSLYWPSQSLATSVIGKLAHFQVLRLSLFSKKQRKTSDRGNQVTEVPIGALGRTEESAGLSESIKQKRVRKSTRIHRGHMCRKKAACSAPLEMHTFLSSPRTASGVQSPGETPRESDLRVWKYSLAAGQHDRQQK